MDYKFKIGDRVRIRKDSDYYRENDSGNPININGTISYIGNKKTDLYIQVLWDNQNKNEYHDEDLELVDIDIKTELYNILTDENISIHLENKEDRERLYQLYTLLDINFHNYIVNNFIDIKFSTYTKFNREGRQYVEVLDHGVKNKTIVKFKDLMKQLKDKYDV